MPSRGRGQENLQGKGGNKKKIAKIPKDSLALLSLYLLYLYNV